MKYQIAIAHRVCPVVAKTASHYTDKFEMVKATTASLARALTGLRVKLVVILDGCPPEYARLFDDVFAHVEGVDYSRENTPAIGNHATYGKQLEILADCTAEAENLYFSEDDYLYESSAFAAMMRFLGRPGVDFVTPLDHPDAYLEDRERVLASVVRVSEDRHWREVASTCCTFMLTSSTFLKARKSLSYYANGGSDYIMGELLTKKEVFSLHAVFGGAIKYVFAREHNWMNLIPALAWLKLGPRLIFAPRFRLWSPMPTLAVHLCKPSLPPSFEKIVGRDDAAAAITRNRQEHCLMAKRAEGDF